MVVGRWPRPWADAQFGAAVRRTTSDLRFLKERIALALLTNRSERTVTRNHDSFIRQGENFFMQRGNNLLERTTRKVGTSNASREERVPGNQFLLLGKIEANAAFRMPRRMHHLRHQRPSLHFVEFTNAVIDIYFPGSSHSDPGRLQIQHFQ